MRRNTRGSASWSFVTAVAFSVAITLSIAPTAIVYGEAGDAGFGIGSSNPWDDNSRTPFKITMSGFLNTKPEEGNIEVVTLGISSFRTEYQYEIMEIDAPYYPQMSTRMILQKMGKRSVDFNLMGPRALLSKVAQSPPPVRRSRLLACFNKTDSGCNCLRSKSLAWSEIDLNLKHIHERM